MTKGKEKDSNFTELEFSILFDKLILDDILSIWWNKETKRFFIEDLGNADNERQQHLVFQ